MDNRKRRLHRNSLGWNQSDPLPCLYNQRRQDSHKSTQVTSDTAPRFRKPMNRQKKKRLGKVKTAMSDRRSERSTVPPKAPCNQNDSRKEVPENSVCLAKKALLANSIQVSRGTSAKDVREKRFKSKRGHRTRKLENVLTDPEDVILISSDDSPGDGPEQRSKNNSGQRKRKLENVLTDPEDNIILISSDDSQGAVPEQRSMNNGGPRKRKLEDAMTDPEDDIIIISSDESPGDGPEQQAKNKRVQKTEALGDVKAASQKSSLQDSGMATSEATPGAASELKFSRRRTKRSIWTVGRIEGTKLTINKKRRLCYQPEDLEAFYRLLEDPVVQNFLAADIFFRMTDKYLLSMVVEYFGRLGLPGHLYNRIHFFLALYIAFDMEEDDPIFKRSIFQFLLGTDTWQDLYKDFQRLQGEFLRVIDYRAWLTRQECEEIQNQNPHHWVWSRVRQSAP
uniref:uncharacterized protein LOC125416759 isoform X2 n=1 Tax=Myodes glareolus TaxID=447135 RepID=UPI0020225A2B|nr:uncharacterized protein LOC125416759 isoform X2 [Myodes glareolus]